MGQSERTEQLDVPFEVAQQETAASPQVIAESTPFIGQWNRLISTTNWEKGKIICEWQTPHTVLRSCSEAAVAGWSKID